LLQSLKPLGQLSWPSFVRGRDWRQWLALMLVVGIVIQLGRAVWIFVEPTQTHTNSPDLILADVAALNRTDPFFAEGQMAVEAAGDTGGFKLFGVSADGDGGGSAIIGLPDGSQISVAAGEQVSDGAILKTVNADHVIVEMNARLLKVGFPEETAAFVSVSQDEDPEPQADAPAAEAAIVDPVKLVAEAGLRPKMEGLSIKGLQISAGENATQLTAAGLQDGDIILSVNGTALTSPQALTTLRQRLSNAATAEISYERGGQRRMTSIRTR